MSVASLDIGLYITKGLHDWPLVMLMPAVSSTIMDRAMGNPVNPSIYPNVLLSVGQDMTFFERVKNTLSIYFMEILYGETFYSTSVFLAIHCLLNKYITT